MKRRDILKAAAGVPLLRLLMPHASFATPTAAPKRVVFWYQPMGATHTFYHPRAGSTEMNWGYDPAGDLHTLLPLLPYKDVTIHFDSSERVADAAKPDTDYRKWKDSTKAPFGLTDYAGCFAARPDKPLDANGHPTREATIGHDSGPSVMTGRYPVGTLGANNYVSLAAQGESIDIALARTMGNATRIRSLQLGVNSNGPGFAISFGASSGALPIVDDPNQSFQTIFTGIPHVPGVDPAALELQKKMARRGAVFDAAYARYNAIKTNLVTPDQQRLEQHFQAYRDVKARLTTAPNVSLPACHSPNTPTSTNLGDPLTMPVRAQSMIDQMVLALACDVTRVITMSWTYAATNQIYSFLPGFTAPLGAGGSPSPDGHHPLSHDSYGDGFAVVTADNQAAYDKKRRIERWHAENLANFLGQLKGITEADGSTLLDNTLVVVVNEMGHSGAHNNSNLPVRLYGTAKGALRTNRYLAIPRTPMNDLYVSIANALDVPMTTFGEPRFDFSWASETINYQWQTESHVVGPLAGL